MSRSALFEVDFKTPLGSIRGQVAIEDEPMRLAELVPTALELTNNLANRAARREEKSGRKITCCAGCGACCCQLVMVSLPEAFYIADMIETLDENFRKDLHRRFDRVVAELERHQMIDELMNPRLHESGTNFPIVQQYFDLKLPCPFLIEESCAIHPNRPVPCRDYNVTSDAVLCADPYHNEISKVPMPVALTIPLAQIAAFLTRSKLHLIPLVLVPRWVSTNTELRQRQWPGHELFQQFLQIVGKSFEST